MGQIVKISGKNTGKDVSVIITDSRGRQYHAAQLGIMTHFEVDADYANNETKSIINEGQVFYETLPRGAKCKMKFSRYNSGLEDLESAYRQAARSGINLSYTIQYQVRNVDGSVSTRQLVDAKPLNFNLGNFVADQDVTQGVDWVSGDIRNNS